MINRFGFPTKNYFVELPAAGRPAQPNLTLVAILNAVTAIQQYLVERTSVPRRVSALDR